MTLAIFSHCIWRKQHCLPGYADYSCAGIDSRGLESVHPLQLTKYEYSFLTNSSPENHTSVSYLHIPHLPWRGGRNTG